MIVDIVDLYQLMFNYDPTASHEGNVWSKGNFDGDADVDFTDLTALILNFSPTGYASSPARMAPLWASSPVYQGIMLWSQSSLANQVVGKVASSVADGQRETPPTVVQRAFADIRAKEHETQFFDESIPEWRLDVFEHGKLPCNVELALIME